uniref:Uncharacterized protein n=1 Tax=viral metagenome TaxID=1070528 RepID=A0A6M3K169_9ZZZZ
MTLPENIAEMIEKRLREIGADGLCDAMGQNCISGCEINDLMPCDEPDFETCIAGEYNPCPTSPTGFKMSPLKVKRGKP